MTNAKYVTKTSRLSYRLMGYFLSALLLTQPAAQAWSMALSNSAIENAIEDEVQFIRLSNNENYQYQALDHIETAINGIEGLDDFYLRVAAEYPSGLLDGEVHKNIGTTAAQNRYVRNQIRASLGRSLIDPDATGMATEAEQTATLYERAFEYLQANNQKFGTPLNRDQLDSGLTSDMLWPEVRSINGENVVVPVLYLTSETVGERLVSTNVTEFDANIHVGSLLVDGVTVNVGRDTFIEVANNLINNGGSIVGEGELEIVSGGTLANLSGLIQAEDDLRIGAHNIENRTIVHRYDTGFEQGYRYGEIAAINSTDGSVTLRSYSDITFNGANVAAPEGSITLAADGNIYIGTETLYEGWQSQHINQSRSSVSYLISSLTAEETIQLIANGEIVIDAAEIVSDEGHIELLAGLGITVEDELTETRSYLKGKFGKRKIEESVYQTVAIRSLLDAGKGVRLHTEYGDITLRASEISSTEGASVTAKNGAVNLLMTTETDHYSYSSVREGMFTVSTVNRGHNIETGAPNTIVGGFAVEALKGVNVQYEGNPDLSMNEQIAELSRFEGLEWMADVRANTPDVDWEAIELKYEEWDESSTSLSPAFAAVISIAVAIATSGAGAGLIGSAGTTAAGTTTALGAAMNAGFTALISQATLAVANGVVNDDIGEALDNFTSNDTLKSLVTSMVTAGAIAKIDAQFFNADKINPDSVLVDFETITIDGVVSQVPKLSLTGQLVQSITNATVRAGVQNVLNDADFEDAFVNALATDAINTVGEYMAGKIKAAFDGSGATPMDTVLKYIAHAGAGCLLGVASGSLEDTPPEDGCAAGAGGAVIGEFVAEQHRTATGIRDDIEKLNGFLEKNGLKDPAQLTEAQITAAVSEFGSTVAVSDLLELRQQGINLARMSAALGAFVSGASAEQINIAADTGENAAENNALMFIPVVIMLIKAIDVALTLYDYYSLADQLNSVTGTDEEKAEKRKEILIRHYGIEIGTTIAIELGQKIIPGAKIAEKLVQWAEKSGKISSKDASLILEKIKGDKKYSNLDEDKVAQAIENASDPDALINQLDKAKSSHHANVIIGDIEKVPGIKSGPLVDNSLPHERISNPWNSSSELDLTAELAETFSSVEPNILPPGTKLYRVSGRASDGSRAGNHWTLVKPESLDQVIGDVAVKPEWNSFEHLTEYTVPDGPGLAVWRGPAAAQTVGGGVTDFHLPGGGEQIVIPEILRDEVFKQRMKRIDGDILW